MKRIAVALLLFSLLPLSRLPAQEPQSSHYKAAEQMLTLMDMETVIKRSIDEMVKAQIVQNPSIAPFESVMREFLMKHMSWDSLKADTIRIYMAEFTEPELEQMNKFYQTSAGRKMIERMPAAMAKSAELGAKRVQEHMPELQQAMTEEAKKIQSAKDAASSPSPSPAASPSASPTAAAKAKPKK